MSKPILCLDFDGVVHSYSSGWKGADVIPDPPVEGAFGFIKDALKHFDVQVFSSRSHQPGGIAAMQNWFRHYALDPTSWLDELKFPTIKPSAMITLDDRAIQFEGVWPEISKLREFQPWNRKQANGY
jgi:hypothetical protein